MTNKVWVLAAFVLTLSLVTSYANADGNIGIASIDAQANGTWVGTNYFLLNITTNSSSGNVT
jgi:hypothetical protein